MGHSNMIVLKANNEVEADIVQLLMVRTIG